MDNEVNFDQVSESQTKGDYRCHSQFSDAFAMPEDQDPDVDSDFFGFSNQDLSILQSTILDLSHV